VTAIALQCAIIVVLVGPVLLVRGGPVLPQTPAVVGAVLFLAVFPSVLAYLLWNRALADLPAGGVGVFLNLITVFVGLFTLLAGSPVSASQFIGGAVVILGVALTNARALRRAPRRRPRAPCPEPDRTE